MDKRQLPSEIERMVVSAQKRENTMLSLNNTVKYLTDLYEHDKNEAYFVVAAMQSIVLAYTVSPSEDEPTREEIFARAEKMLNDYAIRVKEGKNE